MKHYVPVNVYMAIFGQDFTGIFLQDIATYKIKKKWLQNELNLDLKTSITLLRQQCKTMYTGMK
jgi:hypothetical protein